MRGCEWLWDEPKAGVARELAGCGPGSPCKTGRPCPFLPKTLAVKSKARICSRHTLRVVPALVAQGVVTLTAMNWSDVLEPLRTIA